MNKVQFLPQQSLLQSIGFKFRLPLILIIPTLNIKNSRDEANMDITYVVALKSILSDYYGERFTRDHSQYILVNMFHEPLRNAMEHGNKFDTDSEVTVGLWLGEKGLLFAFRDNGNYFSLESTKEKYESRSWVQTSRVDGVGGAGTIHLYDAAKEIIVSTKENTLYASYLLED